MVVLFVFGAIAQLIDPSDSSSSADCLKEDGKAPTHDEEKKHVERFGPKPEYSRWDGSFEEVKKYLANVLNDPNSVEYVFWSKVIMTDNGWTIRLKYRAKNGFGGVLTKDQIFTVRSGAVVSVRDR